jgi:hypothetical protein
VKNGFSFDKYISRTDYGDDNTLVVAEISCSGLSIARKNFQSNHWPFMKKESPESIYRRAHDWAEVQLSLAIKYECRAIPVSQQISGQGK